MYDDFCVWCSLPFNSERSDAVEYHDYCCRSCEDEALADELIRRAEDDQEGGPWAE